MGGAASVLTEGNQRRPGTVYLAMPSDADRRLARPAFDDVAPARRRNLAAVRAKDTKPELVVRRLLHAAGYRYQLHRKDLPGTPDIVFPRQKVVIEIRGCFWHRHPDPACKNAVLPKARADWWAAKLAGNVARDVRNEAALADAGWRTIVAWECEVRADAAAVVARISSIVGPPRAHMGSPGTPGVLGDS